MGLETVELIIETEDHFGIVIHHHEAEQTVTVGHLHALVLRKLRQVIQTPCLTAHAFYRLRRALLELYPYARSGLHPNRALRELIPAERPQPHWTALGATANLTLPPLKQQGSWFSKKTWTVPAAMTLGDLARAAVAWSPLRYGTSEPVVDEEAVYEKLREFIVAIAGVDQEAVRPEARFTSDLGMD